MMKRLLKTVSSSEIALSACAVFFTLAVVAYIHGKSWRPDTDLSMDSPYHIAMADLFTTAAVQKNFPWTKLSVWENSFYDKELGFHVLLMSVRRWAGVLGRDSESPPFFLETAVLLLIYVVVLTWVLFRLGVKCPGMYVPLAVLPCPLFCMRINMVRPHVLSIVFVLIATAWLCEKESGTCLRRLAALGFVFAYCHSNPHFLLFPAGCYGIATVRSRGLRAFLPCVVSAGGVLAGLTFHPQFPNTFVNWKIQCVDVMWQTMSGRIPDLSSPAELHAPSVGLFVENLALPVMVVVVVATAVYVHRSRCLKHAEKLLLTMIAVSFAGYLFSSRAIEFALPLAVIGVALVCDELIAGRSTSVRAGLLVCFSALCLCLVPLNVRMFSYGHWPIPRGFAAWSRENLEPGTYIANFRCQDFPRLFYAAPEYVYSSGLDPMFAYAARPEEHLLIEKYRRGTLDLPSPERLGELFEGRFMFVSMPFHNSARRMAAAGYTLIYQGADGWCFDLHAPVFDHAIVDPEH